MPVYELSLVLRSLPRVETAAALKRVGCLLMDKGAKLQKLENFGTDKALPNRLYAKGAKHLKGSLFVYSFMANPIIFPEIIDACDRDVDIIKHHSGDLYRDIPDECTLDEEMRPPAVRKSVKELLEKSKKNKARTKPFFWHVKEWNYYDIYM